MSSPSAPPPGWYPDPKAPSTERWWDGVSWTDHRRQPGAAPAAPGDFGGGRGRTVALVVAGTALVAALVTGAVLVLNGGSGDDRAGRPRTAPSEPAQSSAPSTTAPAPSPTEDADHVTDQLNGITLPVVDGWQKAQNVADDDVLLTTKGTYTCPYDDGICRRGTVATHTVTNADGPDLKALAAQDASDAADRVYDTDAVGRRPFGGITGHRVVAARQLAVAGRVGYLVRWKVRTTVGPGGYIQSVVFPSSAGSESLVAVTGTLDAGDKAPPLTDLDTIVKGIRSAGEGGGGVGSSIGPTD
ncbi:DUF2510 domain-containing protein [Streptomyces sp. VRA16 Mangrove soil]|uniref:DUF2510 domain-containing protein n=1 Tax=Streptomyces sp. VRA16 Mangrove soil TaxID=2817434 RepID=UPI001A9D2C5A|nr:DUF2510 domain-containing protein [Streptomyces sp. VRA16 Mangrove soil]MBO1331746.1 DUF2510 domain-containing protein [Streptomyces sp. VRA16 Mangrove soil]